MILRAVVCVALSLLGNAQEKTPVPDAAALQAAEKAVKEIFKDEYAKTSQLDRQALARKLLKQGAVPTDDKAAQFVLLRESQDIAAKAGDGDTAIQAIDEMAKVFEIDAIVMKGAALTTAGKNAKSTDELTRVAILTLKLADDAGAADRYEPAQQAAASAASLAKRAKDVTLAGRAEAKSKEFADLKGRYARVKKAQATLAAIPDDAASHLVLGEFLCFAKGDWDGGLPHLEKGSDAALRALATKESANPSTVGDQVAIGDGWWDLAEKKTGRERENPRRRAGVWYERASAAASGLAKSKIEKRLSELRIDQIPGTWTDVSDPKLFGLTGKAGDGIEITAEEGKAKFHRLQKLPPGEYDGISARIRLLSGANVMASLHFENETKSASLTSGGIAHYRLQDGRMLQEGMGQRCSAGDTHVVTVLLIEGDYVTYVDGEEKLKTNASSKRFTGLALQVQSGTAKFDQIRLRLRE